MLDNSSNINFGFWQAKELSENLLGIFNAETQRTSNINSFHNDFVDIDLDKTLSKKFCDLIATISNLEIVCEEKSLGDNISILHSSRTNNLRYWIIDPLDGSYNHLSRMNLFGFSVSLWQGFKPLLGIIYNNLSEELIYGGDIINENENIFINHENFHPPKLHNGRPKSLLTGFPSGLEKKQTIETSIKDICQYDKIRMLGSAVVSGSMVITGRADAYIENGIYIWDVAGVISIALKAKLNVHKKYCDTDILRLDLKISH